MTWYIYVPDVDSRPDVPPVYVENSVGKKNCNRVKFVNGELRYSKEPMFSTDTHTGPSEVHLAIITEEEPTIIK